MFEDIKVDDKVTQTMGKWGIRTYNILKVTKVTPTTFMVGSTRYRKSDGYATGSSTWSSNCVIPFKPEHEQFMLKYKKASNLAFEISNKFSKIRTKDLIDMDERKLDAIKGYMIALTELLEEKTNVETK